MDPKAGKRSVAKGPDGPVRWQYRVAAPAPPAVSEDAGPGDADTRPRWVPRHEHASHCTARHYATTAPCNCGVERPAVPEEERAQDDADREQADALRPAPFAPGFACPACSGADLRHTCARFRTTPAPPVTAQPEETT